MSVLSSVKEFLDKYFFNVKWKCNSCGREIFNDKYFCEECANKLPFIIGPICNHCGRKTALSEEYCSTCKLSPTNVDKGRSVFNYLEPISNLIAKLKYADGRYVVDIFAPHLANLYFKNLFDADYITFVPMHKKARRKRGYNQSELLAKSLSKRVNVPIYEGITKVKETNRQATLNRKERMENLTGAFRLKDKKKILDKKVLIVDDVTTTGSTIEVLAKAIKSAGAKAVYFITVASVPPIDNL